MLSFTQYNHEIIQEETARNKHLDHIEDLMILYGQKGLDNSIAFLKDIIESLKTGNTSLGVSTKWDGKPAIICGENPDNGKFFVSTKSVFGAKEQKAYHTEAELRKSGLPSDLIDKMAMCLKMLTKVGIGKRILQGDLMFTADMKKAVNIDGKPHIAFQPNTIMYAVPKDSDIGSAISSAKLGIAFHTEYKGDSLKSIQAVSYNFNSKVLKQTSDVWVTDPNIYDLSPALMKGSESEVAIRMLKECEALSSKVRPFLKTLIAQKEIAENYLLPYVNSTINGGMNNFNASSLKLNIKGKFEKDINKLKTDKAKQAKTELMQKQLDFVDAYSKQIDQMFELHNKIANIKEILLRKLYAISTLGHFFMDENGIRPTNPEGIVIYRSGSVIKLVNRLEFSKQNRMVNQR
jgi:hypothetical protein